MRSDGGTIWWWPILVIAVVVLDVFATTLVLRICAKHTRLAEPKEVLNLSRPGLASSFLATHYESCKPCEIKYSLAGCLAQCTSQGIIHDRFIWTKINWIWIEQSNRVINAASHGAVTLQDEDGKIFKVNGQRIKVFLEPEMPKRKDLDVLEFVSID